MDYEDALIACGAKVLDFEKFGGYQGDWMAHVEYNGQIGIATGSYGSCTGCDAFMAEFDWEEPPRQEGGKFYKGYWEEITEEEFKSEAEKLKLRLASFGIQYLEDLYELEYFERKILELKDDDWFDQENKEQYEWAIRHLKVLT